ncbi:hypothetical protein EV360DRAFT_33964 [Lentinula raphanica]|nr:hypothetical protein EV360DRAFT_33964 [Lentinula raphanica]
MLHTSAEDSDRPTRRKSKSENKFYRFLTQSRSRSSPRTNASASIPEDIASEDAHNLEHSTTSRDSSCSTSKPATILQSRPLSSTTTATNTTIMPPTPKAKRQMSSSIPKPLPISEPSTSTPKSPTSTKKRLHNIFGRKSSISSSANASPGQSNTDLEDVPALPSRTDTFSEEGHSNAPRSKRNFSSRPTSPSQFPRSRQSSSEPSTSTTANSTSRLESLFISKLFSSSRRAQSPPPPLSLSHSNNVGSPMPTPASRRASTNESISSVSSIHRPSQLHAPQPRSAVPAETLIPVPRITHTPATPLRSGTAPPRLTQTSRNDSLDSGYRFRPLVMDMVDEERDSREVDVKGKGKEKEKEDLIRSRTSIKPKTSNITTSIRSAKHGSFDFERPGWGLGVSTVTRSLSGTSGNSGITGFSGGRHSNRSGESMESATRVEGSATRKKSSTAAGSSKRAEHRAQKQHVSPNDDPAPPYSAVPTSVEASPGSGLSSSLGRSGGKRTGFARLIGLAGYTAHGAFSFEPPVPSPISPTFSHASQESNAVKGQQEETERERENKKDRKRMKETNRYSEQNTPDVSTHSSTSSPQARKGRSLDLGIGLSWAPTKVREDVLLPGGIFANGKGLNGRVSDSTSSRHGLRAGRDRAVNEFGVEDRSKVGRDVAEMFKKALDPEGYRAFKKYVHQFDAHEISFDGPTGIIARARRLLDKRSDLGEESKRRLVDGLVKIVLQNA